MSISDDWKTHTYKCVCVYRHISFLDINIRKGGVPLPKKLNSSRNLEMVKNESYISYIPERMSYHFSGVEGRHIERIKGRPRIFK